MEYINLFVRVPEAVETALYKYRSMSFAAKHQEHEIEDAARTLGYTTEELRGWVDVISYVAECARLDDVNKAVAFDMYYGLSKVPFGQPRRKVREIMGATNFSEASVYAIRRSCVISVYVNAVISGLIERGGENTTWASL